MTRQEIKSVGIDIGTSTTQLVFSRLVLENVAGSFAVPRVSIIEKEVIYRSRIYFTPLRSPTEIDADAVKKIVRREYEAAGMKPEDLTTGAVIITGETARKKNANEVLEALSNMAGDFVVATAGPDLESILAARGAGADVISEENHTTVANLDIGGGTTNIAVYDRGNLKGTCCLDIGGRLIKIEDGRISYIFPKIQEMIRRHNIPVAVNDRADPALLMQVCRLMADEIAMALRLVPADEEHRTLYTNGGRMIREDSDVRAITFSGGVAECIANPEEKDIFRYGDIGVLLGKAIRENEILSGVRQFKSRETIRATVVGAGTHTTEVSGSTIRYDKSRLPLKNVPVLKVASADEHDMNSFAQAIADQIPVYYSNGSLEQIAIAFTGKRKAGFQEIQNIAAAIIRGAGEVIRGKYPLIVIVENDMGKALGNALNIQLNFQKPVICIDGIHASGGDYVDIGEPLADGSVVPVVNKTLVFNT